MDEKQKAIHEFLWNEESHIEGGIGLLEFIGDECIRRGEYEGNEWLVKKMDPMNFLLYTEYILQDGKRLVGNCIPFSKDELFKIVQDAKQKGDLSE